MMLVRVQQEYMKTGSFLWLMPFFCFLSGYFLLSHFYSVDVVRVPSIVGMTLEKAFPVVSGCNLNIRLLAIKQDAELVSGTIISQVPDAASGIRPNQALYVVISEKPPKIAMPFLMHKSEKDIEADLKPYGIRNKRYILPTTTVAGQCIGQFPAPGIPLDEKKVITYIASEKDKRVLLPKFKNQPISVVTEFLDISSMKYVISHCGPFQQGHRCTDRCIVNDQRPLAYSIISLEGSHPLQVYLQVQHYL